MFCKNCGRQLHDIARFCNYCGAVVEREDQGQQVQSVQPVIPSDSQGIMYQGNAQGFEMGAQQGSQQNTQQGFQQNAQGGYQQNDFQQGYQQGGPHIQHSFGGQSEYAQNAQGGYQQDYAAANGGAAVRVKNKKPLIIGAAVIAVAAVVMIFVFAFGGNNGDKIVKAFEKTLRCESFSLDVEADLDGESASLSMDIYGNKDVQQFYMSGKVDGEKGEVAYVDGKYFLKYDGDIESEEIDKDTKKLLGKLFERDWVGAVESNKYIKQTTKYIVKNYDEAIPLLKGMVRDYFNKGQADYVKDFSKTGNTYRFELDLYKMAKAARNDYDIKLNKELINELEEFDGDCELEITISGGYLKRVKVEVEYEGDELELEAEFKDYKKIKPTESRAMKLAEEADKELGSSSLTKNSLKTANGRAKLLFNAAAEYAADRETEGYSFDGYGEYYVGDNVSSKSELGSTFGSLMSEENAEGTIYVGYMETGNSYAQFFVQWRDKNGAIGQYPDPIPDVQSVGEVEWGEHYEP